MAESNTEKILEVFKTKILSGEWKSGQKIPTEPELCKSLNISRTGVREAIKIFESMKVLKIKRGDGTYVGDASEISYSTPFLYKIVLGNCRLKELFDFRKYIEWNVVSLAISNATEYDIEKLADANDHMQHYIDNETENVHSLVDVEIEFHTALGEATHNQIMRDFYQFTFEAFSHFIKLNFESGQRAASALQTHRAIVEAIKNKDFVYASYAVQNSIDLWSAWIEKEDSKKLKVKNFINSDNI